MAYEQTLIKIVEPIKINTINSINQIFDNNLIQKTMS